MLKFVSLELIKLTIQVRQNKAKISAGWCTQNMGLWIGKPSPFLMSSKDTTYNSKQILKQCRYCFFNIEISVMTFLSKYMFYLETIHFYIVIFNFGNLNQHTP